MNFFKSWKPDYLLLLNMLIETWGGFNINDDDEDDDEAVETEEELDVGDDDDGWNELVDGDK